MKFIVDTVFHTSCHLFKMYLFIAGLKSVYRNLRFDGCNDNANLAALSVFSLPLIPT